MAGRAPLPLNSASMVGLKAELYRKKQEAQAPRPAADPARPRKPPAWLRPAKPTKPAKAARLPAADDEEAALLAKSRTTLEAKALLYAELSRAGGPAEEDEESCVDWERKAQEEEREEEWTEYTDVFGRSRRCLREDLPTHLQRNDEVRRRLAEKEEEKEEDKEEEEEEKAEEERPPPAKMTLHYADVQQNEVREHGVGFFQFAADDAQRRAQMKQLNAMRADTQLARQRALRVKAQRKAATEARLQRVRARRGIQEEAPPGDATTQRDADIDATLRLLRQQADDARQRHARHPRREWDRGKAMMSGEKYLEERRNQRQAEFAPTYVPR